VALKLFNGDTSIDPASTRPNTLLLKAGLADKPERTRASRPSVMGERAGSTPFLALLRWTIRIGRTTRDQAVACKGPGRVPPYRSNWGRGTAATPSESTDGDVTETTTFLLEADDIAEDLRRVRGTAVSVPCRPARRGHALIGRQRRGQEHPRPRS